MESVPPIQVPALRSLGSGKAIALILLLSGGACALLLWLIYFRPTSGYSSELIGALPAVNATLNAISATLLVCGYVAVRRRRYAGHAAFMLAALGSSALFLVSYLVYHAFHGDTKFTGQGVVRPIYFFVLISHIVLSVVALPMILTTAFLALAGRFAAHRRVARYALPIWLYVSVTGVLIFAMLKLFQGSGAAP